MAQTGSPPQVGSATLVWGSSSLAGGRAENEDSATCYAVDDGAVALVADGMGGGVDGKLFSSKAVARLQAHLLSGKQSGSLDLERALAQTVVDLHTFRRSNPLYARSGTTVVAAYVQQGEQATTAHICHIGDSRAYIVAASGPAQLLTRDHTYAERLIGEGTAAEQALRHPQALRLTYVLGDDLQLDEVPDLWAHVVLELDSRLVLCTDGVSKVLSPDELGRAARSGPPQTAAEVITKRAIERGSKDNVTAVVVHHAPASRPPLQRRRLWPSLLVALALGAGGVGLARAYMAQTPSTPSPVVAPGFVEATVTPLPATPVPPSATAGPTQPTSLPTNERRASYTPTSTPTNTATPTHTPTRTRTPTRPPPPPTREVQPSTQPAAPTAEQPAPPQATEGGAAPPQEPPPPAPPQEAPTQVPAIPTDALQPSP